MKSKFTIVTILGVPWCIFLCILTHIFKQIIHKNIVAVAWWKQYSKSKSLKLFWKKIPPPQKWVTSCEKFHLESLLKLKSICWKRYFHSSIEMKREITYTLGVIFPDLKGQIIPMYYNIHKLKQCKKIPSNDQGHIVLVYLSFCLSTSFLFACKPYNTCIVWFLLGTVFTLSMHILGLN